MSLKFIPDEALDTQDQLVHVSNIVAGLLEALNDAAEQAVGNWAEQTAMPANAFMQDHMREVLLGNLIGFLTKTQPRAHQLTSDHVEAYFSVSIPPAKDPIRNE